MSETLAPCPFCGGEAELERSNERFEYGTGGPNSVMEWGYYVYCTKCSAGIAAVDVPPPSPEEAAEEWNRRVESADHAALVARIAELEAQLAAARPDQVAAQMAALADNDAESRHMDGDALLCATLRALGYGDAVDEFVRWMKWYA